MGLKDSFQAKATLQSIIENYKGNDDILPIAKQKLDKITGKNSAIDTVKPDSTQQTKPDTTNTKPAGNGGN